MSYFKNRIEVPFIASPWEVEQRDYLGQTPLPPHTHIHAVHFKRAKHEVSCWPEHVPSARCGVCDSKSSNDCTEDCAAVSG